MYIYIPVTSFDSHVLGDPLRHAHCPFLRHGVTRDGTLSIYIYVYLFLELYQDMHLSIYL